MRNNLNDMVRKNVPPTNPNNLIKTEILLHYVLD